MAKTKTESLGMTPVDLGLPAKFHTWRRGQEQAITDAVNSDRRFIAQSMPTGWGKSLCYVAQALLCGMRVCVLTATKALQDQLVDDFGPIGMVDVRGRANYQCVLGEGYTCEEGRHARCPAQRSSSCPYRAARKAACDSQLVVTNYSYWIYQHKYGEGLGDFDLLVCDEAHSSPDEVCDAMSVMLTTKEVYSMLRSEFPKTRDDMVVWRSWAAKLGVVAHNNVEELKEEIKDLPGSPPHRLVREISHWRALESKLESISDSKGEWAIEDQRIGVKFDPLWASDYAESVLFLNIPHVLLVSATVCRKTLSLLGIPDGELDFLEYPPVFAPSHSPVYLCRTGGIRVNRHITEAQKHVWLSWIDSIISRRLDRRGVIHSVAYRHRDYILEHSEWKDIMVTHDTGNAVERIRGFLHTPPPVVLVSPAASTGWDFPYAGCRYQIIAKSPWPNMMAKVLRMREESDKRYAAYLMAQQLVQACGRGNRAADDLCENFITDWSFKQWQRAYRDLFPKWFWRLFHWADVIPRPPDLPEGG